MQTKAQTLLEVIIASVIIAMVMAGLGATFVLGKRYSLHTHSRLTAAELGRYYLDNLTMLIRQDRWDNSNCLYAGNCGIGSQSIERVDYHAAYTVTTPASLELRKVLVNLTWDEIEPQ
jgi:Tfp pilus assembly protein PilV